MSDQLPAAPTADQIDLAWLVNNQETLARYMATVQALSNLKIVVVAAGVRQPPRAVQISGGSSTIEIVVP